MKYFFLILTFISITKSFADVSVKGFIHGNNDWSDSFVFSLSSFNNDYKITGRTNRGLPQELILQEINGQISELKTSHTLSDFNGNVVSNFIVKKSESSFDYFGIEITSSTNDYNEILPVHNQIKSCLVGFRLGLYSVVIIRSNGSSMPSINCTKFGESFIPIPFRDPDQ